ncbi:MAG: hypothetical protein Q9M36_13025 [Sulfurovum sp.]|nr:hypothetical protein [Sulfurovum sp.]
MAQTKEGTTEKNLSGVMGFFLNKENHLYEEQEKALIHSFDTLAQKLKHLKYNELLLDDTLSEEKKKEVQEKQIVLISLFRKIQQDFLKYQSAMVFTRKIQFDIDSSGLISFDNIDKVDNQTYTYACSKDDFNQAYYFIKFIFHNHVHHSPSNEDIVRLYPCPTNSITKKKFASLLLSDIKKYMVELRNDPIDINGLRGVSSYAKTLVSTLHYKKSYITKEKLEQENIFFNNFSDSVDLFVESHDLSKGITKLSTLMDYFFKVIVLLLGMMMAIRFLYRDFSVEQLVKIDSISQYILTNPIETYLSVFLLSISIVLAIDAIANRGKSLLHRIINTTIYAIEVTLKKHYNPTLSKENFYQIKYYPLKMIISMIQSLHYRHYTNKRRIIFLKPLIMLSILFFLYTSKTL